MFTTDCKKFYNLLRQKSTNVKHAPTKEETENFWKEIMEKRSNTTKKLTGSKTTPKKS
jgi:benzoyl-CoA reductase/2-hydroxyglutaryl-CoA dehydratase subunit BcrC/BadD/HgdB